MTTQHIHDLKPGHGTYAFFLTAQGRIVADANVLCFEDSLLIDTEPERAQAVYEHLDRFIIADDVTLEDETAETAQVGVEGPQAEEIVKTVTGSTAAPAGLLEHAPYGHGVVVRVSYTGQPGWRFIVGKASLEELVKKIEAAGAVPVNPEDARLVRVEEGRARYGEDFTEMHIPHETQLLEAVHFSKGCYLGQEIVERVRSRGLVNRLLVPVEIESREVPEPGAEVLGEDKAVGRMVSGLYSPALEKVVGFAMLRREVVEKLGAGPGGARDAMMVGGSVLRMRANRPLGPK
jgi:tRNA-modifying protein YgfZ